MAEFINNNAKNASTNYTLFEFNCKYYFCIFYEKDFNPYLKSKIAK